MPEALRPLNDILLPILLVLGGVILLIMGIGGDFRPLLRQPLTPGSRIGAGALGALLLIAGLGLYLLAVPFARQEETAQRTALPPTLTPKHTPTAMPATTPTVPPTPTAGPPTPTVTAEPTSVADVITMDKRGHTMRLIPAGAFTMGESGNTQNPARLVTITHAFWIDVFEVTTRQYQACVDDKICQPPHEAKSATHPTYYGNMDFNYYPVINVDWSMADIFCRQWRNGRLPTEAEWEYAARGVDERAYPWGNGAPDCDVASFAASSPCTTDTQQVDSYSGGTSPFGIYNLAGNVSEWVADWYGPIDPRTLENPSGPTSGKTRAVKGGSWRSAAQDIRISARLGKAPAYFSNDLGFRCVRAS